MKLNDVINMYERDHAQLAVEDVLQELATSTAKYGPFSTTHEAYGVLKEEVDELWDACKRNNLQEMEAEAVQVAAMAIRLIIDSRRTRGISHEKA